jgi:gliding motility-associated protein GldC
MTKKTEIKFEIELDENNVPKEILWTATDNNDSGKCNSILLSMWDAQEQNTLKIDLWTKEMMVEEMKSFVHQTFLSMADTLEKATNDSKMAKDIKDFCLYINDTYIEAKQ